MGDKIVIPPEVKEAAQKNGNPELERFLQGYDIGDVAGSFVGVIEWNQREWDRIVLERQQTQHMRLPLHIFCRDERDSRYGFPPLGPSPPHYTRPVNEDAARWLGEDFEQRLGEQMSRAEVDYQIMQDATRHIPPGEMQTYTHGTSQPDITVESLQNTRREFESLRRQLEGERFLSEHDARMERLKLQYQIKELQLRLTEELRSLSSEERALVNSCLQQPDDRGLWLILADYLAQAGKDAEQAYLRQKAAE